MALKLTAKKQIEEFNLLFSKYEDYDDLRYHYLDSNSYQYELLNYVYMECLIDDYNCWNKNTMRELKDILISYGDLNDFKECGFSLKSKRDLIIWHMRIPSSINIKKDEYLEPHQLACLLEDGPIEIENIEEKFYEVYVYPAYKRYINLMKNLKPFLRQIKDNTIICKNEEIFTIILLAKNDMRIDYYAMKNIISYL